MTLKGDREEAVSCPSDFLALLSQVAARVPWLSHLLLGFHPWEEGLRQAETLSLVLQVPYRDEGKENKMSGFMMSIPGPHVPFLPF